MKNYCLTQLKSLLKIRDKPVNLPKNKSKTGNLKL